jgi:hypothetical protein
MVLMRGLAAVAAVAFLLATAYGCGDGLSQSNADLRCNQEQLAKTQCFDTEVYSQCESCMERCGSECAAQNLCPEQYLCPGDSLLVVDGGSTGAGG